MKESRIIIRRGQLANLQVLIDVYDPQTGKLAGLPMRSGPAQEAIDKDVRALKTQLERRGHFVSVKEM